MSTILLHRKIYTRVEGQQQSVKTKEINSFLEKKKGLKDSHSFHFDTYKHNKKDTKHLRTNMIVKSIKILEGSDA